MAKYRQQWRVLYTRPRYEARVSEILQSKGVKCLLPKTTVVREYKSQRRMVEQPLFPSYVFVCPESLGDYYLGLDQKGVLGYVKFGNEIASVSKQVIDSLRLLDEKKCKVQVSAEPFPRGEQVVICEGPLTGLNCEVVDYKGVKKALIRVQLLGSNVLINIDAAKLRRIPDGLHSHSPGSCA